jgi:hypothetical protein
MPSNPLTDKRYFELVLSTSQMNICSTTRQYMDADLVTFDHVRVNEQLLMPTIHAASFEILEVLILMSFISYNLSEKVACVSSQQCTSDGVHQLYSVCSFLEN